MSPISHDYGEIHKLLEISNVESSMERNDLLFSFRIHKNFKNCSDILQRFEFKIPSRVLRQNQQYFHIKNCDLMARYETPIVWFSKVCNTFFNIRDIFNDSLNRFIKLTRSLLKYE